MKKILFLDIDGVLNSAEWIHKREKKLFKSDEIGWAIHQLDPAPIALLNTIVELTNCDIVLSSTWRKHFTISVVQGMLTEKGFKYSYRLFDRTPETFGSRPRGYEIQSWLEDRTDVGEFVIVDDDSDMGLLKDKLVQTDAEVGLTRQNADEIVRRFNGTGTTVQRTEGERGEPLERVKGTDV